MAAAVRLNWGGVKERAGLCMVFWFFGREQRGTSARAIRAISSSSTYANATHSHYKSKARQRQCHLQSWKPEAMPSPVIADRTRLKVLQGALTSPAGRGPMTSGSSPDFQSGARCQALCAEVPDQGPSWGRSRGSKPSAHSGLQRCRLTFSAIAPSDLLRHIQQWVSSVSTFKTSLA